MESIGIIMWDKDSDEIQQNRGHIQIFVARSDTITSEIEIYESIVPLENPGNISISMISDKLWSQSWSGILRWNWHAQW